METTIQHRYEVRLRSLRYSATTLLAYYELARDHCTLTLTDTYLDNIRQNTECAIRACTSADALTRLQSRNVKARQALLEFQKNNGLTSDAYVTGPVTLCFGIAILLALGALEIIYNSQIFSERTTGFKEALLLTFLLTFVNIVASFLAGRFLFRNLRHVNKVRRTCFGVMMSLFTVSIIFLNLYAAHYRCYAPRMPTNATEQDIRDVIWNDPLRFLGNIQSALLFLIGLIAATIATMEGYCLVDDSYPGYGQLDRCLRKSEKLCERSIASLRKTLRIAAAHGETTLRSKLLAAERKVERFTHFQNQLILIKTQLCHATKALCGDYQQAIKIYRDTNTVVRTDPPPKYYTTIDATLTSALGPDTVDCAPSGTSAAANEGKTVLSEEQALCTMRDEFTIDSSMVNG